MPVKSTETASRANLTTALQAGAAAYRKAGSDAAIAAVERLATAASPETTAGWLTALAQKLQAHDPAGALQVAHRAQSLDPKAVGPLLVAGQLQDRLGDRKACAEAMRAVLDADGVEPEQALRAANLLVRFGAQEKALSAAREAFDQLDRPLAWASALMYIAQRTAAWDLVAQLAEQLREAYADGDYVGARESPRTHLLWCGDEKSNNTVLRLWSEKNLPAAANTSPPRAQPTTGRKLRIGYLSSDFREHPTAYLLMGLLRHHDRERFEIILYCSSWDDGSETRRELESRVDEVHTVSALNNVDAARLIRSHGIDVLVELNGPTRAHRMGILPYRPAPVQIDYLGWPGSVGGRVVDYIVADPYTVPAAAEKHYAEKLIRVSHTYQCNDYAAMERPVCPSREAAGLPNDGRLVLGMFNAINKVHGEVWKTWMAILRTVPESLLWILDPGAPTRKRLARAAAALGVEPSRLIFAKQLKQREHLARLQCCDLMLDPWPYGGHTSTSDALFAGVPVVALEGKNFAGRVSGGLLRAAGLARFVRDSREAYAKTAVRLLRQPAALARFRSELRERVATSPVFDARRLAGELEAAFVTAVDRAAEGLEPVNIGPAGLVRAEHPRTESAPAVPPHSPAGDRTGTAAASMGVRTVKTEVAGLEPEAGVRPPLVLICGPWSSGTSAVTGLLARAGLHAPGPYVRVNDPQTPETFEMLAFRSALRSVATEKSLQRAAERSQIVQQLREFAAGPFAAARSDAGLGPDSPMLLKHGLSALVLPELEKVFSLTVIGVLRPIDQIEATRKRRNWPAVYGGAGAKVIYEHLFRHLVDSEGPFELVRYRDLLNDPAVVFDRLCDRCGLTPSDQQRREALAFVSR